MNFSRTTLFSTMLACLLITSCKRSENTETETSAEANSKEDLAEKRSSLWKLMPAGKLNQLGIQRKYPLGGMHTAKAEFLTYPFNLGPTGITAIRSGNGYKVSTVAIGSPAEGKLKPGDYIVGANGKWFIDDRKLFPEAARRFPNPQMGMAIERAEANGGQLALIIREGKSTRNVKLQLKPIGAMGDQFPNKSLKAEFLAATQAEILLAHQNKQGGWSNGLIGKNNKVNQRTSLIPTCMCAVALMSTGDAKYDPAIKKAFELILKRKINSFHSWQYAYKAWFLTEYHLRYGDPRVKPAVQEMVNKLADGYFYYNGVYGYGHGLNSGNYRYNGINACTAHASYALAMGRILGCDMPNNIDVLLAKSLERLAPDGSLDYMWSAKRTGKTPSKRNEDQGRTGTASAAYYYLGGRPEQYQKFITYLSKNKEHADGGHATGNTLSWASSGLAIAMADDTTFAQYMKSKVWQFAFNRTWNYGYYLQPSPHGQHRGSDHSIGVHYINAANTILFNRHKKNLITTGMKQGIPTVKPSYLTEVLGATQYYQRQGKIVDIIEAINIMKEKTPRAVITHLERLKKIPIEAPDYHQRVSAFYAASLPNVMRSVANTAMSDEQRNQALISLLGLNYSRAITAKNNKLMVSHVFTPPNLGTVELVMIASDGNTSQTYRSKKNASENLNVKQLRCKTPFTRDQDVNFHSKIIWNGIQMDLSYDYKKEHSQYVNTRSSEGMRGAWTKKPWTVSYGQFYATIKRTKNNGCLQVTYPDGTVFETALMAYTLIKQGEKADTLRNFLKSNKLKSIPDGTKIHFKYFHRGGKPLLPMCDEITILE